MKYYYIFSLLLVEIAEASLTLLHRYSFSEAVGQKKALDSVGLDNCGSSGSSSCSASLIGTEKNISFDGHGNLVLRNDKNSYLQFPVGLLQSSLAPGPDISLEFWMSTSSNFQNADFFSTASDPDTSLFNSKFKIWNSENLFSIIDGYSLSLSQQTWTFSNQNGLYLVCTIAPSSTAPTIKFYYTSPNVITVSASQTDQGGALYTNNWNYVFVGRDQVTSTTYPGFNGNISELRIWSGLMDAETVQSHYEAGPDMFIPLPTASPTQTPTIEPSTVQPTASPTQTPTIEPSTVQPTVEPSTVSPTLAPTTGPTETPTIAPTSPTSLPTGAPSGQPSSTPSNVPSGQPTVMPTSVPSCSLGEMHDFTGVGCLPCSPGEFISDLGGAYCEPCPKNTFSPLSGSTHCDVCPYPTATVVDGQNTFRAYNFTVSLAFTLTVLLSSFVGFVACICYTDNRFIVLINLLFPTLDVFTDIAYLMTNDFYSYILFICGIIFVMYPLPLFVMTLVKERAHPHLSWSMDGIWWLSCGHEGDTIYFAKFPCFGEDGRFPLLSCKMHHTLAALFLEGVVWVIAIVCQLLTLIIWPLMLLINILFLFLWFCVGVFLHMTKTVTIGRVWTAWFRIWTNSDEHYTDVDVDTEELNKCLQEEFIWRHYLK
jgi:hypothetical protein